MRVLCIFGTRPEAIKMAPVCRELRSQPQVETMICVTGQHREMLDQVLELFAIEPDYDLDIMREGQSLTEVATAVLAGVDSILLATRPDWVLVQGDTTTTLAAAMAAFHRSIPVGHVEAGLRTFDISEPRPEEFNRRAVALVTELHFAPTQLAAKNLLEEGVPRASVVVTGNTVVDAALWVSDMPLAVPSREVEEFIGRGSTAVLFTVHRRENHGAALTSICEAVVHLAHAHPAVRFLAPVHMNPNVSAAVRRHLAPLPNVLLSPPLSYESCLWALRRCRVALTDSGGLQEEAVGARVPVLVLRDRTERPEGIHAGGAALVGCDSETIVSRVSELLVDGEAYRRMATAVNPYGDGRAAARIVDTLLSRRGHLFDGAPTGGEVVSRAR